jgi:hypothetical protein
MGECSAAVPGTREGRSGGLGDKTCALGAGESFCAQGRQTPLCVCELLWVY